MKKAASGLKNIEATTSGFVGFSAFTGAESAGGTDSTKGAGDIVYSGSDTELAVAMRKVSKRDETTKIKALQDILTLIQSRDKPTIKEFLSPWCTAFVTLALHNDRRVRVATFAVMEGLVIAGMRKSFVPFMSRILPVWWLCCCDPAREAASLADTSLGSLLGHGQDRAGALAELAGPVINQLGTWLEGGPEDISDMRMSTTDEAKERAERVQACCLEGLGLLLTLADTAAQGPGTDKAGQGCTAILAGIAPLLTGKSVWKLCQSPLATVRRSAYGLARTVVSLAPQLVATQASLALTIEGHAGPCTVLLPRPFLVKVVLCAALGDETPSLQTAAWQAVLASVRAFATLYGWHAGDEQAHSTAIVAAAVRAAKLPLVPFLPPIAPAGSPVPALAPAADLWSVLWRPLLASLKRSGYGAWAGLYPSLLPLLANMPVRVQAAPESSFQADPANRAAGAGADGAPGAEKKGKGKEGKGRKDKDGEGEGTDLVKSSFAWQLLRCTWLGVRHGNQDEALPPQGQAALVAGLAEAASAVVLACTRAGVEAGVAGTGWAPPSSLAEAAASVHAALLCAGLAVDPTSLTGCPSWPVAGLHESVLAGAQEVLQDIGQGQLEKPAVVSASGPAVVAELWRLSDTQAARMGSAAGASGLLPSVLETLLDVLDCGLWAACTAQPASLAVLSLLESCLQDKGRWAGVDGSARSPAAILLARFARVLIDGLSGPTATAYTARLLALHGSCTSVLGRGVSAAVGGDVRPGLVQALAGAVRTAATGEDKAGQLKLLATALALEEGQGSSPCLSALHTLGPVTGRPEALLQPVAAVLAALPPTAADATAVRQWLQEHRLVATAIDSAVAGSSRGAMSLVQAVASAGLLDVDTATSTIGRAAQAAQGEADPSELDSWYRMAALCLQGVPGGTVLPEIVSGQFVQLWSAGVTHGTASAQALLAQLWRLFTEQQRNQAAFACQDVATQAVQGVKHAVASGLGQDKAQAQASRAAVLLVSLRSGIASLAPQPSVWTWQAAWRFMRVDVPAKGADEADWACWTYLWVALLQHGLDMQGWADLEDVLGHGQAQGLSAVQTVATALLGRLRPASASLSHYRGQGEQLDGLLCSLPVQEAAAVSACLDACLDVLADPGAAWAAIGWLIEHRNAPGCHVLPAAAACLAAAGLPDVPPSARWSLQLAGAEGSSEDVLDQARPGASLSPGARTAALHAMDVAWSWASHGDDSGQGMAVWGRLIGPAVAGLHRSGVSMEDVHLRTMHLLLTSMTAVSLHPSSGEAWTRLSHASRAASLCLCASSDGHRQKLAEAGQGAANVVMAAVRGLLDSTVAANGPSACPILSCLPSLCGLLAVLSRLGALPAHTLGHSGEVLRRLAWLTAVRTLVRAAGEHDLVELRASFDCLAGLLVWEPWHAHAVGRDAEVAATLTARARALQDETKRKIRLAREARLRAAEVHDSDGNDDILEDEEDEAGLDLEAAAAEDARLQAAVDRVWQEARDATVEPGLVHGLHPSALPAPPPVPLLLPLMSAALVDLAPRLGEHDVGVLLRAGLASASCVWAHVNKHCRGNDSHTELVQAVSTACQPALASMAGLVGQHLPGHQALSPSEHDALYRLLESSAPAWSGSGLPQDQPVRMPSVGSWSGLPDAVVEWVRMALQLSQGHVAAQAENAAREASRVEQQAEQSIANEREVTLGQGLGAETPAASPAARASTGLLSSLATAVGAVGQLLGVGAGGPPRQEEEAGAAATMDEQSPQPATPVVEPTPLLPVLPPVASLPRWAAVSGQGTSASTPDLGLAAVVTADVSDVLDVLLVDICLGQPSAPAQGGMEGVEEDEELSQARAEASGSLEATLARGRGVLPSQLLDILEPQSVTPDRPLPVLCLEVVVEAVCNRAIGAAPGSDHVGMDMGMAAAGAEACVRAYLLAIRLVQTLPPSLADELTMYLAHPGPARRRDGGAVPGALPGGDLYRALEAVAHLLCADTKHPLRAPSSLSHTAACDPTSPAFLQVSGSRLVVMGRALLLRCCDSLPVRVSEWWSRLPRALGAEVSDLFSSSLTAQVFSHQARQLRQALDLDQGADKEQTGTEVDTDVLLELDGGQALVPRAPTTARGLAACAGLTFLLLPKPGQAAGSGSEGRGLFTKEVQEALSVRVDEGNREVTAAYTKEEARLAIRMALPPNYPIKRAHCTPESRKGITDGQWRRIELQLSQLLTSRDGTLADAVSYFASSIDKEFEGVEPCPICYMTVAPTNGMLPKMACPTCSHGFHKECVLKWFVSSHDNKCPLCRQPFRQLPT